MQGKLVFQTNGLTFVQGNKGPLLRFTVTWGFVPTEAASENSYLAELTGCLGLISESTDTFVWMPPLHRIGRFNRQLITFTPEIIEGVAKSLQAQGAVDSLRQKYEEFRGTKGVVVEKKEKPAGIPEEGKYVVE